MALFGTKKKTDLKTSSSESAKEKVALGWGKIVRPVVSEKALAGEASGRYVFEINDGANKTEIKREIEKNYSVKVLKVNIVSAKDKSRFFKGRIGYRSGRKKAVVKLVAGQKIEMPAKK